MHGKGGKAMDLVSRSELAGKIIKLTAMRLDTKLPWLKEAIHLPECSFDLKHLEQTEAGFAGIRKRSLRPMQKILFFWNGDTCI